GWKIEKFDELYNQIDNIDEANTIINDLKLCDPAVGSGHFLVSALNEIIAIKSELKILKDKNGKRLKEYTIEVENDELYVTDEDGEIFNYIPGNKERQRVQETLFTEKQIIIENCLFGVDINPNSVKICQLRLWIELLKNAFYKEKTGYKELETLPNIDINIKCGNSLISRFALDADLKPALKKSRFTIQAYKIAVQTYRQAENKEQKREMRQLIYTIKNDFISELSFRDKVAKKYVTEKARIVTISSEINRMKLWQEKVPKKLLDDLEKASANLEKYEKEINDIKQNTIYRNALEWRFEFPEVLNDEGDFEGFDVVIGNPPYIRQEEVKEMSSYFADNYKTFSGKSDVYVFFYERGINIIKQKGIINYITSGKFFEANYGKPLIDFLINDTEIKAIINFNDLPVFGSVTAYPLIFLAFKNKKDNYYFPYYDLKELPKNSLEEKLKTTLTLNTSKSIFIQNEYKFVDNLVSTIISKTKLNSISLKDFCGLPIVGVKTGYNEGFITELISDEFVKSYAFGRGIKKYQPVKSNYKIIFPYDKDFAVAELKDEEEIFSQLTSQKEKLSQRAIIKEGLKNGTKCWYEYQQVNKSLSYNNEYIVYPNVSLGNNFTLSQNAVIDMTAFIIKSNSRYLLSILNSRLIAFLMNIWSISRRGGYLEYKVQYVEKIPIKNISITAQQPFITLVDQILEAKQQGNDTTDLEKQIDDLVYELYGITEEEKKVIERN
ncbi:MAG: Eco57I restriction-modification methylase domain-containing protein, partial [Ginsengibacter sp.]